MRYLLGLAIFCVTLLGFEDLGVWGETYEIAEKDFLEAMEMKAKDLNRSKIVEEAKSSISRNMRVERLAPECRRSETRSFEPVFTLDHDVVLPDGTVLYKKGYRFNVLKKLRESGKGAFGKYLLFVDADDPAQRAVAAYYKGHVQTMVAAGDMRNLIAEGIYAYRADKRMLRRFDVRCVPSIYIQKGDLFEIREISPEDLKRENDE